MACSAVTIWIADPADPRAGGDHHASCCCSSARRSPGGWRARGAWWKEAVADRRRAAARAAADGARLLSAGGARPARAGRPDRRGLWGARTLAFTFGGLVIGSVLYSMPFVVQPIRNAFEAIGERPLEVAATLRASPLRRLLDRRGAAGAAGLPDRRRARLRPHRRRVRRRADDRRQHPRQDQGAVGRDLSITSKRCNGARRTSSPAGMVVFAFAVILAMTLLEKRLARAGNE